MTEHKPLPPFAAFSGPRDARILLIAEAWGQSEALLRKPLVGASGQELWRMLGEAMPDVAPELHSEAAEAFRYDLAWVPRREPWLHAASIAMTNVLNLRPPDNKLDPLCGKKAEVGGDSYELPPLFKGKYLRPDYLPELERLFVEIETVRPNVIVALGNTACWALLRATNIGIIRGALTTCSQILDRFLSRACKVIPTYHPAGVLRQWNWRPIAVADLMKASREAASPDIKRVRRSLLISPSIEEVEAWVVETLANRPERLANDIETAFGQIRMMSFARSPSDGLTVPFVDPARPDWNYWPTPAQELRAWQACLQLLQSGICILGQNWMYDIQYHARMGLRLRGPVDDTMLLHHALYPELQKGLGFLVSVHGNEVSWKQMRKYKPDSEKRDE